METKQKILFWIRYGASHKQIASIIDLDPSTIDKVHNQLCPNVTKKKGGAPLKLTDRNVRTVITSLNTLECDNVVEATKRLNKTLVNCVTANTTRNYLKKAGLRSYARDKKPFLTKKHIADRLAFARLYRDFTVNDWKRVIFSDESKVCRFGHYGPRKVWLKPYERNDFRARPHQKQRSVKYGGGHVMVWGCIGSFGVGHLGRIVGIMDSQVYCGILEGHLIPTLMEHNLFEHDFILQQDNDTKHTSAYTKQWMAWQHIELLQWPANSPDLNPIENIWGLLKKRLRMQFRDPSKDLDEHWARIQAVWAEITPKEVNHLLESMPKRIQAVLRAKGFNTKY